MAPPNIPLATRLLPLILLLLLPLLPGPTSAEILGALTITNALTRREGGGGGGKAEVGGVGSRTGVVAAYPLFRGAARGWRGRRGSGTEGVGEGGEEKRVKEGEGEGEEGVVSRADGPLAGLTWQVQGLTRVADTHLNSTDFLFALVDDQSKETSCSVAVPGSDPTASWYGRSCVVHPNYSISWGYIKETDSAVMTVCDRNNGTGAWFGFQNITAASFLGDSKKEPVYYTGCS
ncbi:uncharacterized protein THITE_2125208 [Thermothielavioides terrestris NRRL 8126]|uniref:AA1-like domain-containing protein n=1 Tax=Thermothielavioides terrestris (strain ATCC 38088 / NRRL 8126) TaxID=578455 RepID=G2QRX2_THETT|nr:uncharacterized protein THITE_2125208 [Thermothielavioides terrestris NRRL 8126]AEO62559.1 hypothetical protein THITE_2125208 [Thermothielavioides terrestris NRRL 8126]